MATPLDATLAEPRRLPLGWIPAFAVLLCVIGVGASISFFLRTPYNPGFVEHPGIMAIHVGLGAVYLALAPFQLSAAIRRRAPGYHRAAGRTLVGLGLIAGGTALWIGLAFPFSGVVEQIVIGCFAAWFLASLCAGLVQARRRRFDAHRAWMIRALAIATGIATMRLIFIPSLFIFGAEDLTTVKTLSIVAFSLAFALHAVGAELYLRRGPQLGAPS